MPAADDRRTIAWLHRRAGFGVGPGELDALVAAGVDATIERLVDPDAQGVAPAADPWAGVTLSPPAQPGKDASPAAKQADRQQQRQEAMAAIGAWLDHMAATPRPLESWLAWFWHGLLVSGLDKVHYPLLMVGQVRTYRELAFAPFPQLLRAATVDPAMLLYLDGRDSTGTNPNENFGREVMELFALGVGHFTEDDVKAAARALTGWRIELGTGGASFVPARHDDQPQTLLGVSGVHDVDSVLGAITSNPACGPWVAGKLARAVLGPDVDGDLVQQLGSQYAASGYDTRALLRSILQAGARGQDRAMVWAPVPWLAAMVRATGATVPTGQRLQQLRAAGQVPMTPPNVAGWPSGAAWLSAATVVARFDLAALVAAGTPSGSPALVAAQSFALDALADALGRPEGFGPSTVTALGAVRDDPVAVLTVAIASPDLMVA
jgi:uncharacterized protein (DUF1800 family)